MVDHEIELKKEKVKLFGDKIVRQKRRTFKAELTWGLVALLIANIVPIVVIIVCLIIAIKDKEKIKFMHSEWEIFTWALHIEIIILIIVGFYIKSRIGRGGGLKGMIGGMGGSPQKIQFQDIEIQRVKPLSRYLLNWVMYVIILIVIIVPIIIMLICAWIGIANHHKFKIVPCIELEILLWAMHIEIIIALITFAYIRLKGKKKSDGGFLSKFKRGDKGGDIISKLIGRDSGGDMDISKIVEQFKK